MTIDNPPTPPVEVNPDTSSPPPDTSAAPIPEAAPAVAAAPSSIRDAVRELLHAAHERAINAGDADAAGGFAGFLRHI